jgi:hypothetical protein
LIAFAVVAATALVVGLLALAWASYSITSTSSPRFANDPLSPEARVAFQRAGTMHNFSYLGGFLGILTATGYLLAERVRLSNRVPAYHVPTKTFRNAFGWGILLAGPFLAITPILFASHFIPVLSNGGSDIPGLALSLTIGLCGVALLTFPRIARILFSLLYIPALAFLLINYRLTFHEVLFGG